ncbi:hypothetical protein [Salsuginibacillus kocurii]|uniref:hypothetical protein n=1 Tax=Salsuginibacillus kocurii TaxID=427078 RepID=UPI00035E2B3C|nr:hypothetical protein [Salsuginibacillus kocurii]
MNYFQNTASTPSLDSSMTVLTWTTGDVSGDSMNDHIYLLGEPLADSPLRKNIKLLVVDGQSHYSYIVDLPDDQGYDPRLFLGDFTGNGVEEVMISIASGGSGGYSYYMIYSFVHHQPVLLFDNERFDNMFTYQVNYEDDFKVHVVNNTLNLAFIVDISLRPPAYLKEIYLKNGQLKAPIEGWVSGLNQLYPIDFNGDGVYDLLAVQRVIGQYSADGLGLMQTQLSWDTNIFAPAFNEQSLAIYSTEIGR